MTSPNPVEFFIDGHYPKELCAADAHVITSIGCELIPSGILRRVCDECSNRTADYKCYFDPCMPDTVLAVLTSKNRAILCDSPMLFEKKKDPRTRIYNATLLLEGEIMSKSGAKVGACLEKMRERAERLKKYAFIMETLYKECFEELYSFADKAQIAAFFRDLTDNCPISPAPDVCTRLECTVIGSKLLVYSEVENGHTFLHVTGPSALPMLFLSLVQKAAENRLSMTVSRHPFINMPLSLTFPHQKITLSCLALKKGTLCPTSDFIHCENEIIKKICAPYVRSVRAVYDMWEECRLKYLESAEDICCICAGAMKENALDAFIKRLLIGVFCDDLY